MSPPLTASSLVAALERKLAEHTRLDAAMHLAEEEILELGNTLKRQFPHVTGALNGFGPARPHDGQLVLSQRKFGVKWGTSEKPVQYAVTHGLIYGPALSERNQIVVGAAEEQLAAADPLKANSLARAVQAARAKALAALAGLPDPEKPATTVGGLPEAPMPVAPAPEPPPSAPESEVDRIDTEGRPPEGEIVPLRTMLEAALDQIDAAGIPVEELGGDEFMLNGHRVGVDRILDRADKLRERLWHRRSA